MDVGRRISEFAIGSVAPILTLKSKLRLLEWLLDLAAWASVFVGAPSPSNP